MLRLKPRIRPRLRPRLKPRLRLRPRLGRSLRLKPRLMPTIMLRVRLRPRLTHVAKTVCSRLFYNFYLKKIKMTQTALFQNIKQLKLQFLQIKLFLYKWLKRYLKPV